MTNDAKDYYKGGRRVLIGGVPCRVRADTKSMATVNTMTRSGRTLNPPSLKFSRYLTRWTD